MFKLIPQYLELILSTLSRKNSRYFFNLAQAYRTPKKVQEFLKTFDYNPGATLKSAKKTAQSKSAHCMEAAMLAAAILEHSGFPPLVMSLESKDLLDHVVFVFQRQKKWGAIGFSRDEGLFGRKPVYRSIRDLAWSYFDPYIDKTGRVTAYQLAHLDDTQSDWRWSLKNVWKAENYLLNLRHIKLRSSNRRFLKQRDRYFSYGPMKSRPDWW